MSIPFYGQATYNGTAWIFDTTDPPGPTCVPTGTPFINGSVPMQINADQTVQLLPPYPAHTTITGVSSFDAGQTPTIECIPGALVPLPVLENTMCPEPPFATLSNVVYVKVMGTGSNNGTSWADATDLTTAISIATAGDELWLQAGTYETATTPSAFTIPAFKNLSLYGGFNGTEIARSQRDGVANPTTVQSTGAVGRVFEALSTAIFDTLTITNGNAIGGSGGLITTFSTLIVRNCTFSSGTAGISGGGIFISNPGVTMTLCQCAFLNNSSVNGGAVYVEQAAQVNFFNCKFQGNTAGSTNAGQAAFVQDTADFLVINCQVTGNGGATSGDGAFYLTTVTSATILQSTFADNVAQSNRGALFIVDSPTNVRNTIFYNNTTTAPAGFRDITAIGALATVFVCNYMTSSAFAFDASSGASITTSSLAALAGTNPLFVSPPTDYSLQVGSVARDAGNVLALTVRNCSGTPVAVGVPIDVDLARHERLWTTAPDLGAFEYQSPTWSFFDGLLTPLPNEMCPEPPEPPLDAVIYVKVMGTGANDGTSWGDATDLATALTLVSTTKTELWLDQGTYVGPFSVPEGAALYGGFDGNGNPALRSQRNPTLYPSLVSGSTTSRVFVVTAVSGAPHVIFDSLTIKDGKTAAGVGNTDGGGIYDIITGGAPLIVRNCIFTNNALITGGRGGAIFCAAVASLTLCDCVFSANTSVGTTATRGGAINVQSVLTVNLFNVTFSDNGAEQFGGAFVIFNATSVLFINCVFYKNLANTSFGAAGYFINCNDVCLLQVTAVENHGSTSGAFYFESNDATARIFNARNCIFYGNIEDVAGNGLDITYVTSASTGAITGNVCNYMASSTDAASFVSSVFAGSTIMSSQTSSFGNGVDPLFVNQATGDLRLTQTSPAINVGNNTALMKRHCDNTVDVGVDVNIDRQHLERIIGANVDLGAYEFAPDVDTFEVLLSWDGMGPQPCVHGDTLLVVQGKGLTPIKEVKRGDMIWCQRSEDEQKQWVEVAFNARIQCNGPRFVNFDVGSLGAGRPSLPLKVRAGHPVLVDGVESECQKLVNGTTIAWYQNSDVREVYALATTEYTFFFAQARGDGEVEGTEETKDNGGVLVKTWDAVGFDNYARNHADGKRMFYTKQ